MVRNHKYFTFYFVLRFGTRQVRLNRTCKWKNTDHPSLTSSKPLNKKGVSGGHFSLWVKKCLVCKDWITHPGCSLGSAGLDSAPLSQAQGKSDLFLEVLLTVHPALPLSKWTSAVRTLISCASTTYSDPGQASLSMSASLTEVFSFCPRLLAVTVCQRWLSALA